MRQKGLEEVSWEKDEIGPIRPRDINVDTPALAVSFKHGDGNRFSRIDASRMMIRSRFLVENSWIRLREHVDVQIKPTPGSNCWTMSLDYNIRWSFPPPLF